MKKLVYSILFIPVTILLVSCGTAMADKAIKEGLEVDADNAGLHLPKGFGALLIADSLGPVRHIAVTSDYSVYAKMMWPGDRGGILFLTDTNKDGKIDKTVGFSDYGGTEVRLHNGYLYASSNTDIYRYKLDQNERVIDPESSEIIVQGLIDRRQHNSKSFTFDKNNNIYVNIGAYSNACQETDRTKGSPGMEPCPILDSAGGIWQFSATHLNQSFADGKRYATGLRNVVGLDWNSSVNKLFVTMHGRDQLHSLFPELYDEQASAELPAETLFEIDEGDNCGWPYTYYDELQEKIVVAPEYGGDGKKTPEKKYDEPVMAFPGHLAPNDLLFYTGTMFPEKYRNGAFIAFHGSWNRAPLPQKGFFVVFVPFNDGKPSGDWEIFADAFSGTEVVESPGDAKYRPTGLAQGPDGSLFVSDDSRGGIFRITYNGKK